MATPVTRRRIASAPGHGVGDFLKDVYDSFFSASAPTVSQPDIAMWFSGGGSVLFDESADEVIVDGVDIGLQDSDELRFGDADDLVGRWDGTDFDWLPLAAGSDMRFGSATTGLDVVFSGLVDLNLTGVDLQMYLDATSPSGADTPGTVKLVNNSTGVFLYAHQTGTTWASVALT